MEQVDQLGIGWVGLAHAIDDGVALGVGPAPKRRRRRASGLDKAAVVEAQRKVGIAHRAAVAKDKGLRLSGGHARVGVRRLAKRGVDTGLTQLLDQDGRKVEHKLIDVDRQL